MKNPKSRALYHYWNGLRQGREVPCRKDIDPRQIKMLLPDIFILERFDHDHLVFRLAGTRICDFYGREFRAHNFLTLWRGRDRFQMRDFLKDVLDKPAPGVAMSRAESARSSIDRHGNSGPADPRLLRRRHQDYRLHSTFVSSRCPGPSKSCFPVDHERADL